MNVTGLRKYVAIWVTTFCVFVAALAGQADEPVRGISTMQDDESDVANGRYVVAVIGVDDYQRWPKLDNAVRDALGTQRLLQEKFGFEAPLPPLIDAQATKEAIEHYIHDDLRKALRADDSLVLMFSGHGHTRTVTVGAKDIETGYIVPVEAGVGADERWSEYIKIDEFLDEIALLPARHILVLLDSCHSGFALTGVEARTKSGLPRYEATLRQKLSRRVVTSARSDELALDSGPVANHSLFTGTLIEGLDRALADLDDSGFITSSEIGLYLQQRVSSNSESFQTPDFGAFERDDRGEMVISISAGNTIDSLERRAFAALRRGELAAVGDLVDELEATGETGPRLDFLRYRLDIADLKPVDANASLQSIQDAHPLAGTIPLSDHDLREMSVRTGFWRAFLALGRDRDFPLDVEFLRASDEDEELVLADPVEVGDFTGYELMSGGFMSLQIRNPTREIWHVYMMDIDQDGRINPIPLWDSDTQYVGLKPGSVERSFTFRHDGADPGMSEFRLFASRTPIHRLITPPSSATRGVLLPMDDSDTQGVKVTSIFYRAVARELSIADPADPGLESAAIFVQRSPDGSDFNPGYRLAENPSYPGIAVDYRRTHHVLEMLKPDIWLAQHNEYYDLFGKLKRAETEGVNAWIDAEGYRRFVAGKKRAFEDQVDLELGVKSPEDAAQR